MNASAFNKMIFLDGRVKLFGGDNRAILSRASANSIDAVVTDPPYALKFMGKSWDTGEIAHDVVFWREILRVLKPGGHLLAFGGTRTNHRMVCAIEDAGFEVRDMIAWLYGTGFPKSMDVSKAIDKAAGAEREVIGQKKNNKGDSGAQTYAALGTFEQTAYSDITAPATDAAREWDGWGTALKPALEPICLARKPLSEGTVAANMLLHGTGAINVDGCRVETDAPRPARSNEASKSGLTGTGGAVTYGSYAVRGSVAVGETMQGRFPANVIHDGSDEVLAGFPDTKAGGFPASRGIGGIGNDGHKGQQSLEPRRTDAGSAARFFYQAKASKTDRAGSKHPTVKPISLMRYLCRLVTPPGGTVLDPFAGSGTTGEAARLEGFNVILIEREAEYLADIAKRFTVEEK